MDCANRRHKMLKDTLKMAAQAVAIYAVMLGAYWGFIA
jgi:hypothetical protein